MFSLAPICNPQPFLCAARCLGDLLLTGRHGETGAIDCVGTFPGRFREDAELVAAIPRGRPRHGTETWFASTSTASWCPEGRYLVVRRRATNAASPWVNTDHAGLLTHR